MWEPGQPVCQWFGSRYSVVSYLTINTVGAYADQHCACFCFIAMATLEKGSQDIAISRSTFFLTVMNCISCDTAFYIVHNDFLLQLLYISTCVAPSCMRLSQRTCLQVSHCYMTVIAI